MPFPLAGHRAANAATLGLALVLSGCSGTPLGERLSNSFATPPAPSSAPAAATPAASGPAASGPPASTTAASGESARRPQAVATGGPPVPAEAGGPKTAPAAVRPAVAPPADGRPAGAVKPKPKPAPPATATAPYRVTLQLPGADPSAPAEAVTEALRAAGVRFEVETIERIPAVESRRSTAAPATPAPPPR